MCPGAAHTHRSSLLLLRHAGCYVVHTPPLGRQRARTVRQPPWAPSKPLKRLRDAHTRRATALPYYYLRTVPQKQPSGTRPTRRAASAAGAARGSAN